MRLTLIAFDGAWLSHKEDVVVHRLRSILSEGFGPLACGMRNVCVAESRGFRKTEALLVCYCYQARLETIESLFLRCVKRPMSPGSYSDQRPTTPEMEKLTFVLEQKD